MEKVLFPSTWSKYLLLQREMQELENYKQTLRNES